MNVNQPTYANSLHWVKCAACGANVGEECRPMCIALDTDNEGDDAL